MLMTLPAALGGAALGGAALGYRALRIRRDSRSVRAPGPHRDLSVVIPLKGWDASLPQLIEHLVGENRQCQTEVLLIADADHPRLSDIPNSPHVRVIHPPTRPARFRDKNFRLHCGAKAASHDAVLFLDSDVQPTPRMLDTRCEHHPGMFSFCLPVYAHPKGFAEWLLAAFVSHNNLFVYRFGFTRWPMPTAIGPSMLFSGDRQQLLETLEEGASAFTDDHCLGHHLTERGVSVHCADVPVVVGHERVNLSEVNSQIVRWLTLVRTASGTLTPEFRAHLALSSAINALPLLVTTAGLCALAFGRPDLTVTLLASGLALAALDGLLLSSVQRGMLRGIPKTRTWLYPAFVPVALALQPYHVARALMSKEIRWRGAISPIQTTSA